MTPLGYYCLYFILRFRPLRLQDRWGRLYPISSTGMICLQTGDVEDIMDTHVCRQLEAVGQLSNPFQHFIGPNEAGLELLGASQGDVLRREPDLAPNLM